MKVSVIIVTWNSSAHIAPCLASIKEKTTGIDYEVIVVDNASTDGTADLIEKDFPWVHLISNTTNDGFGRANNLGAREATGELLFFLNDDTVLTENSIQIMSEKMSDSIGVLGCHLTFTDGSHQDSVRRDPQFKDQFVILTKLHNFFPRMIEHYLATETDYTKEQDVEQLMGACMMMRRSEFKKHNGFDPRFFIWFEEVDLIKRIRESGKRIVYTPATQLIHLKGQSFGKVISVKKQRMFQKSQRQYFFKHHGILKTAALISVHPLGLLLSCMVQTFDKLGGDSKKLKHGQS